MDVDLELAKLEAEGYVEGSTNGSKAATVAALGWQAQGDELASAEIVALPTLPLLGREGYVGKGTATLIAAYPKVGKTTLLAAILAEWASAESPVLVLTEESRLAWEIRLQGAPREVWSYVRFVGAMNAEPSDLLELFTAAPEPTIVVDTARAVFGFRDENDNSDVARKVSPWIAAARERGRTFVVLHHGNKAGGDHGRGISGGHALFGLFDAALEIERVPGVANRRLVRGYARLLTPQDFIYERDEVTGVLGALGDADNVKRDHVRARVEAVLTVEWATRKEIIAELDEPKPGGELVRQVLNDLVSDGEAERDPVEDKAGTTYKWRSLTAESHAPNLPTTAPSIGGRSGSGGENGSKPPVSTTEGERVLTIPEIAAAFNAVPVEHLGDMWEAIRPPGTPAKRKRTR